MTVINNEDAGLAPLYHILDKLLPDLVYPVMNSMMDIPALWLHQAVTRRLLVAQAEPQKSEQLLFSAQQSQAPPD
jgi:hypothetical protein